MTATAAATFAIRSALVGSGVDGGVGSDDGALDECRREVAALQAVRAVADCSAAAGDDRAAVPERVEAYRLLGMTFLVEGEEDLAQDAFRRMLLLDPTTLLGNDAGPNAKRLFVAAALAAAAERNNVAHATATTFAIDGGVVAGATIYIDGLSLDEAPAPALSVGHHVIEVNGAVASFDVVPNVATHVAIPVATTSASPPASPTWPRWVVGGVALTGALLAIDGGLIEYIAVAHSPPSDINNIDEWSKHARDTVGFLPAGDEDPFCPKDGGHCARGSAWGSQYGPARAAGVSEPAHFTMTAVSRENELGWRATQLVAVTSLVVGTLGGIVSGVAFVILQADPTDAPDDAR